MAISLQGQRLVSCSTAVPDEIVDHAAASSRWTTSLVVGTPLQEGSVIANTAAAHEHGFPKAAMRHMGHPFA